MSDDIFDSSKVMAKSLSSSGGRPIKLISFNDAIELVMVLPGKLAKEVRQQFANVIHRYMAGDASLVPEIQANAGSAEPVAQMARATLEDAVVPPPAAILETEEDKALDRKRKALELRREELQLYRFEVETAERREAVRKDQIANFHRLGLVADEMKDQGMWEHVRKVRTAAFNLIEDMTTAPTTTLVAGGSNGGPTRETLEGPKPLKISTVVAEMGYGYISSRELINIGTKVKQLYVEDRKAEPRKEMQSFPGGVGYSNVYYESDRDLIMKAVEDVLSGTPY